MINIIQSEVLKSKRAMTRKLLFCAPLFFVIIALPQKIFMPEDYIRPWKLLISIVYNWWPVIFVPLGVALLAALGELQEKKAGKYRCLHAHNISPSYIWIGKVITMAIHTLISTVVLMIAIVIAGFISAGGSVPWMEIFTAGFVVWLASLAIIPVQLWAAVWKGTFFSMAVGFTGMITGVLAAAKSYWVVVPC